PLGRRFDLIIRARRLECGVYDALTKNLKEALFQKLQGAATKLDNNLTNQETNTFLDTLQSIAIKIHSYFESLPKELQKTTDQLMNKGWFVVFFDDYFDSHHQLEENLTRQKDAYKDKFLMEYFNSKAEEIERILLEKLPRRESQIKQAFIAYREQLYYLSIPALLILAESVCRDLSGNLGLYSKHKQGSNKAHKPLTDDLFDNMDDIDQLEEVLFIPLRKRSSLTKNCSNPTAHQKKLLNRHLIIHGQSDNYGSEINSIKSLSLVYYVFYTLEYLQTR
ncbi:hypothetical protein, partial [Vibrio cholerae]